MKAIYVIALILIGTAFATMSPDSLAAAKALLSTNASCDKLNSSQLELLGDYYMEQMHPGAAHEIMDNMMGGEGSESLRQQHIQIAEVLYCGRTNTSVTYGGMMAMMPMFYRGYYGGGMMGYGMMGYPSGMMGYGTWGWIIELVFWLVILVVLVLLAIWLYKKSFGRESGSGLDILNQRYAKGEITKKQYEEMKKDIGG